MVNYSDLYKLDRKATKEPKPNPVAPNPAAASPSQDKPQTHTDRSIARSLDRPNGQPVERSSKRTGERVNESSADPKPKRRQARRYSFEIYEDQIDRLKRIALQDQLRGGELNISVIARNALDRYLPDLEAELREST